jgi:anti-anti-sigma regulatory factor
MPRRVGEGQTPNARAAAKSGKSPKIARFLTAPCCCLDLPGKRAARRAAAARQRRIAMNKPKPSASTIEFACPDEDVIVVRIKGRGSFENSSSLRKIPEIVDRQTGVKKTRRMVLDLEHCATIDSTFIGETARLALGQQKAGLGKMVLVNVNKHVHQILNTLGVALLLDIHDARPEGAEAPAEFESVERENQSKLDRIVLMLEAHQQLIDLNAENQVRFRNVIDCLEAALGDERGEDGAAAKA